MMLVVPGSDSQHVEDCEDFVGRGPDLQRLVHMLGAPGGELCV